MRLGRLHISGASAWPDHVLDVGMGRLWFGAVLGIRSWALGLEVRRGGNPCAYLYAGWWCFEFYLDLDRSWED